MAAAIAWGEDHFDRVRFSAIIGHENEPSLKLARKFGFKEVERTTYKDHPTIVLYRRNLLRTVHDVPELDQAIARTLLHEVGHLRGEDDGSLRDRGLE